MCLCFYVSTEVFMLKKTFFIVFCEQDSISVMIEVRSHLSLSCFLSIFSFPSLWLWNLSQWAKYSGAGWAVRAQDRWDGRPPSATAQHANQLAVKAWLQKTGEREREKKKPKT